MHTCTCSHHPFLNFLWGFSVLLFYPQELLLPTTSFLPSTMASCLYWQERILLLLWWDTAKQWDIQYRPSGLAEVIADLKDKEFITHSLLSQKVPFPRSNELLITSFEAYSCTCNKINKINRSQIAPYKKTTWVGNRNKILEGNFLYLWRDRSYICKPSLTAKEKNSHVELDSYTREHACVDI